MKKNNRKGFTIVELVIVIAVIGILAGIMIPTFSGVVADAEEKALANEIRNAYTKYLFDNDGDANIGDIINVDGNLVEITLDGYANAEVELADLEADDHFTKDEDAVSGKYDLYVFAACEDDTCANDLCGE